MPVATHAEPTIDAPAAAGVLARIAEIASETLELGEVIGRVGEELRGLVPFENLAVVRIDGDRAILHASTDPCENPGGSCNQKPLTDWSPRWRPQPGPLPRIDDARAEMDPSFPMDAEVLAEGVGSVLWEPFRMGAPLAGGVMLCSRETQAFGDQHQKVLRPIAALLGAAVEHWRIWNAERLRRERLARVETLLGTLAESLDVREVFERLSAEIQPILPHHLVNLTEIDQRARTIRVAAFAGTCDVAVRTDPFPLTDDELEERVDFAIIDDVAAELEPDTERRRLILASGLRSWLRVPVRLSGEVEGSLSFLHREPSRYGREDAEVARRVADRVALSLSHRRLAEEARTAAEARERAERLAATVETLSRELESREASPIVGDSRPWRDALAQAERVAPVETTVLVTGESGTGKEVVARLVHQGSPRAGKPFVAINCAALPEQLLESELFGHDKGAFTGAVAAKVGRIEQAAGGTLFLDEVAEMSPPVQAKLLRVLEQREFQRVGGSRTLEADVRLIAATNRDLGAALASGAFREDLYYRLNVFQIHLPPLRERPDDVLLLADTFLDDLGRRMNRPAAGISRDARDWLLAYHWPGNVRELRNAIERALLLCDGGLITHDHLPAPMIQPPRAAAAGSDGASAGPEGLDLMAVEQSLVEKALAQARGNKSRAARLLGLTRAQLYSRLERHGLR